MRQPQNAGEAQTEPLDRLTRQASERTPGNRTAGPDRPEAHVVGTFGVGAGRHVVEQEAVRRGHRRAQSCSERTPTSPARSASMPCTAAPSPCTVVMHGMFASTAAVRIS